MCYQECALHGDLVLWLRDQAVRLLAGDEGSVEAERKRLDDLIRDWFFKPHPSLQGYAPRDIIWAEQMGQPNPIDPERVGEFFEDDCPVCTFEKENLEAALAAGEDPGFHWHYDDGGWPLIANYDPEGHDERWAAEGLDMDELEGTAGEPATVRPRRITRLLPQKPEAWTRSSLSSSCAGPRSTHRYTRLQRS
jgi:hypothetical protein